jgi:hypothetical protein
MVLLKQKPCLVAPLMDSKHLLITAWEFAWLPCGRGRVEVTWDAIKLADHQLTAPERAEGEGAARSKQSCGAPGTIDSSHGMRFPCEDQGWRGGQDGGIKIQSCVNLLSFDLRAAFAPTPLTSYIYTHRCSRLRWESSLEKSTHRLSWGEDTHTRRHEITLGHCEACSSGVHGGRQFIGWSGCRCW